MKTLLTTTALALFVASPMMAQDATTETDATGQMQSDTTVVGVLFLPSAGQDTIFASDIIGMDVESSEADYDSYGADPVGAADRSEWDDIGDVNDIAMSPDGSVEAVIVDIGGFLGMGEHTVALDMNEIRFMQDDSGMRFVAVNSTREELENAPEYEWPNSDRAGMADTAMTDTMDPAAPAVAPVADDMGMNRPMFERTGYQDVDYDQLTAEQLEGAPVYDANDESIGDVGELLLGSDGAITQAVVDVGGFLGMGEHPVALDFGEMQVMQNADGGDVRVYIDQTREALEARPAYEG